MLKVEIERATVRGLTTPLSIAIERSQHVALAGPPSGGKSALLGLIHGSLRLSTGRVVIGGTDFSGRSARRRPVFHSRLTESPADRSTVRRMLVRAARSKEGLAYDARVAEIERVADRWELDPILDRKYGELSTHEQLLARLAQIELFRPAVLLAERLFAGASAGTLGDLGERFWRLMRSDGATVLHEISHPQEVAWADRVVVLDGGAVAADGTPREAFAAAAPELAALLAPSTSFPVLIRAGEVSSPLGSWPIEQPPFEGPGFALAHPADFALAGPGEESDFFLSVGEARFAEGRWEVRGAITGGMILRVWLPPDQRVRRGKLLPLRVSTRSLRYFRDEEGAPGGRLVQ